MPGNKDSNTFTYTDARLDAVASQVGGQTIDLQAGRDIAIAGSQVISDQGTRIQAGHNLNIVAVNTEHHKELYRKDKTSGLLNNDGVGVIHGQRSQILDSRSSGQGSAGSAVGTLAGNVDLKAGSNYRQTGSTVAAPEGDIDVTAGHIRIDEARKRFASRAEHKAKQTGRSVGLSNPVLDGMMSVVQTTQAIDNTDNPRMQALGTTGLIGTGLGLVASGGSACANTAAESLYLIDTMCIM